MDIATLTHHEKELRDRFEQEVADQLDALADQLGKLGDIQVIVGIPYVRSREHLERVIEAAGSGLVQMDLTREAAVVPVGPLSSRKAAASIAGVLDERTPIPVHGLSLGPGLDGHAWRVHALLHAANRLHTSLLILSSKLAAPARRGVETESTGFSSRWVSKLLTPVYAHGQDLAVARFDHYALTHPVEGHLVYPVLAGVFGWHLPLATSRAMAVSRRLVESYLSTGNGWPIAAGDFGAGAWLAIRALEEAMSVCEVPLAETSAPYRLVDIKRAFLQIAGTVFHEVAVSDSVWTERPDPIRSPAVAGADPGPRGRPCLEEPEQLRSRLRLELDYFENTLYPSILPDELRRRLEEQGHPNVHGLVISEGEWIALLRNFLTTYRFDNRFDRKDVVAGLFPFFLARVVTFMNQALQLSESLSPAVGFDGEPSHAVACREVERALRRQADRFVAAWPEFRKTWHDRESETAPYLPRLGVWEFVPTVGVIVPQELKTRSGESAWAYNAYRETIDRYRTEYTRFAAEHLGVLDENDSEEVLDRLETFMERLEASLGGRAFPGDITTFEGARKTLEHLCKSFSERDCFHLTGEAATRILLASPPSELMVRHGTRDVHDLLEKLDPLDALGMAAYTDQLPYLHRVLEILEKQATPSWFESSPLWATTVDISDMPTVEPVGAAALARLGGRVIMSNLPGGTGGEYPHLWFLLRVCKSVVGTELFSEVWESFAGAKSDFGRRVALTIREHWGRRVLSAHNAFENRHHRIMRRRLRRFADSLEGRKPSAAEALRAACEVYHLSITLSDTTFVPMSAWTWASYSARGGTGVPTPLSSLVERDWSTRDFFTTYLESAGLGGEEDVDKKVFELIRKGREPEDLRRHMLGVSADPDELVVQHISRAEAEAAGKLTRPRGSAMLEPTSHAWESRYVLNPAALRLDGTVYILYRAFGDDQVSRIGLAWSKNGIDVDGRLDEPIFVPETDTETQGCEDPRTVVIDGRIYMLYTAWDGIVPQIAMASIPVEAFLQRRFDRWERHGLAYPGLSNKDAILYPEEFGGRYAVYHRIDPNMWVSYVDTLACPWPRAGHKVFAGPRSGMMWDGVKIGAGAPPIKTTHGWLNIYHGVDYERSYRLGAFLMALDDPSKVLYRTPNPILEPETPYELGDDTSWVPHVVFTCGAVPATDTDVVGPDDEILVYYGAADTVIGVAQARLRDIVPIIDDL